MWNVRHSRARPCSLLKIGCGPPFGLMYCLDSLGRGFGPRRLCAYVCILGKDRICSIQSCTLYHVQPCPPIGCGGRLLLLLLSRTCTYMLNWRTRSHVPAHVGTHVRMYACTHVRMYSYWHRRTLSHVARLSVWRAPPPACRCICACLWMYPHFALVGTSRTRWCEYVHAHWSDAVCRTYVSPSASMYAHACMCVCL